MNGVEITYLGYWLSITILYLLQVTLYLSLHNKCTLAVPCLEHSTTCLPLSTLSDQTTLSTLVYHLTFIFLPPKHLNFFVSVLDQYKFLSWLNIVSVWNKNTKDATSLVVCLHFVVQVGQLQERPPPPYPIQVINEGKEIMMPLDLTQSSSSGSMPATSTSTAEAFRESKGMLKLQNLLKFM